MGSLLRYLIIAIAIVLAAAWLFTVAQSCNNKPPTTNSATSNPTSPTEENDEASLEDLYVEESDVNDGNADSPTGVDTDALPDNANAADDLEAGEAGAPDEDPLAVNTPDPEPAANAGGATFGKYLVVAGSYLSESNAKLMAGELRDHGYKNSEVLTFDLSQYYSVTTGRYNELSEARKVARRVKAKGIEAYVHKMRGKKMNR